VAGGGGGGGRLPRAGGRLFGLPRRSDPIAQELLLARRLALGLRRGGGLLRGVGLELGHLQLDHDGASGHAVTDLPAHRPHDARRRCGQ
jgi:hypothetical protein